MTRTKLRLLLLSVGSRVAESIIDALGARRDACVLIGTNSVAEAAGNFRCDTAYLVPPAASGAAYLARVAGLIAEERPDLVIPCHDDDILPLAALAERPAATEAVLLVGSVAAARIFGDKIESARFAARHGLPFAETAADGDGARRLAQTHGLPLIGKPRDGNGGRGVLLLRSNEEIARAFGSNPGLIAQPLFDPPQNTDALIAPFESGMPFSFSFPETRQYSTQALIGPDGSISGAFGRLGTMVGGQSVEDARCDDPELLALGRAFASAAAAEGWKGPLTVQFKRGARGFVAHAIDARFTAGTAAAVHLGFDEIAEVTRMFLPKAALPALPAPGADVVQKHNHSTPLPGERVAALRASGKWSRPRDMPRPASGGGSAVKLRLLLISAGSLAAQNVIDALGERRERCVLIGTNSIAEAVGVFRCDVVHLVPPAAAGAAYIARIGEVMRQERADLVIPCRDDDILALAMLAEQSPRTEGVLLTGTAAAARIMNDKVESARFAVRHGLAFAPTAENAREGLRLAEAHGLPLIGKPRLGFGGRGVLVLRSAVEIERAFAERPDLIAQPFLAPPANLDALTAPIESGLPFHYSLPEDSQYSLQVLVGPDREITNPFGCVNRQFAGQSFHATRCGDPDLIELGRSYARAAALEGWRGPLNIQLKRTAHDGFVAFELNGRFSGGTAARACMGCDDVGEAVRRFLPGVTFPSIEETPSDLVLKSLGSFPLPRDGVSALRAFGRWPIDAA